MLKILKNFLPIPAKNTNIFIKTLSYFDVFGLFQKDPFGNWMVLKRMVIFIAGWPTYWRIAIANKLKIEGLENLKDLPNTNVFFISNHQTYFADVITFYHIFCNHKWGFGKKLMPIYLFSPRASIYYVAAKETMKTDGLASVGMDIAGIAWEATEGADTRCWGLLPNDIQVMRIETPKGTPSIQLTPLRGGRPVGPSKQIDVTVIDGRNTYVLCWFPDARSQSQVITAQ